MESGGAIGVDIGSAKSVLAAVRKRGIDIILSDSSNKSTPTVVAFTDEERLVGDAALNQQKKNFLYTLQFFPRFLGLNIDCVDQIAEEQKYITTKVIGLENKRLGFEVKMRGQTQVFTPEQVLAYYLKKLKTFFENSNIDQKDIVISVPSYFSNVERQAVLDAAEIAHFKTLRLINESTAVALTYGFFRKPDLPEKGDPRHVAFVDFGHSKVTVTIVAFWAGKMKILCHHSDRNLGARNMDYVLVEKLGEEFTKKFGVDPRKNARARLRMLDIIEKQRKILSANLEATIHLESLLEDEDLHKNIKRAEFEEIIAPMVEKFGKVLQDAWILSGLKKEQLHSVEMVGEATRIPAVQEKCKEVFGVDQVSRTLNSLECVARGCSLQAAMLSPLFKVADYEVQEYNSLPVSITYQFNPSGDQKTQEVSKELFPLGSSFPSTKTITFDNKKQGLALLVHYSPGAPVLPGLPTQVAQYKVKDPAPKHDKYSLILRVSNNIHQIPQLENVEFIEEWTEEEKIPVKKDVPAPAKKEEAKPPAEGDEPMKSEDSPAAQQPEQPAQVQAPPQQEYEIRKKAKKSSVYLHYETSSHALPPQIRKQFRDNETELFQGDQSILEHKALRNELESFSYEYRNNISDYGSLEKYVDPTTKASFLEQINQTVEWLYADGLNASSEEYKKKLQEFKKIGLPIKERHRFYSEVEIFFEQFQNYCNDLNQKVAVANLSDAQRSDIINKHTEAQAYFDGVKASIAKKQLHEDPGFNIDDVHQKLDAFKNQTTTILNTPPPKEEKPAEQQQEQKKEDKKDAEMKDEGTAKQ